MQQKLDSVDDYKKDLNILVTYPNFIFKPIKEISEVLSTSLIDSGIKSGLMGINSFKHLETIANTNMYSHIICINVHDYITRDPGFYISKPTGTKLIAYTLEQTPIKGQNSYWASMRLHQVINYGIFFDYVAVESECKRDDITNIGFRTLLLDMMYHPKYDTSILKLDNTKVFDVLFLGCDNERRKTARDKLIAEGISIAYPSADIDPYSREGKAQLIAKSKLCVNIHFSDMEYFEKPRLLYDYAMNKANVLSEKLFYPEVFEHTKELFMSKYANIIPNITTALKAYASGYTGVGESLYTKFKESYHFEKVINNFVKELLIKEELVK